MEEAADLILKEDEELTSIQQLQKNRSIIQLSSLYPSVKVPVHLWRPLLILATSVLAYVLISNFFVKNLEASGGSGYEASSGTLFNSYSIDKS
jgi:hypothetical protein